MAKADAKRQPWNVNGPLAELAEHGRTVVPGITHYRDLLEALPDGVDMDEPEILDDGILVRQA